MFVSGPVGTRVTGSRECADETGDQLDRALGDRPDGSLRQVGAVEPGRPVDVIGDLGSAARAARAAPAATGTSVRPEEGQDPERVAGRVLQAGVAGDGRDAQHAQLGAGEREEDRQGVVVAGVAVEDDRERIGTPVRYPARTRDRPRTRRTPRAAIARAHDRLTQVPERHRGAPIVTVAGGRSAQPSVADRLAAARAHRYDATQGPHGRTRAISPPAQTGGG